MAILYIFKKSLLEAKKYSLQYIVYISGISIYVVFYDSVSYYYYYFEKALSIEAVKKGRVKKNGFYYYYYV